MTKYSKNNGKPWTHEDIRLLREFAQKNAPTRAIGLKLGRTDAAIRAKASDLKISLQKG